MKLQPIVYTTEMDRAVAWYGAVLGCEPSYASAVWTSFAVGGGSLGIHRGEERPKGGAVELSLIATEPLEQVVERLATAGIAPARGIVEETFGRSLVLVDPDGAHVQVNEHDH